MYDSMSRIIWTILLLGYTYVDAASLRCYNGSLDNPLIVPLDFPRPLIDKSCINTSRVTKFFISGFNRNVTGEESVAVLSAYIKRGDVNVLYLDWAEEAKIGGLGTILGYIKAASNTQEVGFRFAAALLNLRDGGLEFTKVHLVGHSLGAQIAGITGNTLRDQGYILQRATCLDPARPLYSGLISFKNGVGPECAKQVDVVHTDPGGYGLAERVGTADFWPNYEGGKTVQPGCSTGEFALLSQDGLCSHILAWKFFVETINECNCFPAASSPDYATWTKTNGTTNSTIYMGEYVSPEARGNYYLVTNDRPLYGKGDEGTNPNNRIRN
uniref:Vitellogenin n=1 Tax=Papilio polytes TaxID=76194 RepID=I4DRL5_PAPPL|nr:lipase member I-like precursor [Papilio polytes]BAM20555.1 vitellogenin [Papilio polytes]